jgi:thioredoxin-related protein
MQRKIFFLLILMQLFCSKYMFSQENNQKTEIWYHHLESAKTEAVQRDLPLLIVFAGSDWCRPCIQLNNQVFSKEEFKTWASANIIPVHFDFPRQKHNALSKEQQVYNDSMADLYNPKGAFPKVIIADKNGTEIGSLGFINIDVSEYISKLEEIIRQIYSEK